jgi:DNA-binding SARP family transcriptional activator
MVMQFGILGPLEVVVDGVRLDLGAHRQRALLAILLIRVDEVVSLDRLIDQLWGDTPPNAATGSLQVYVSNLRRVLEPDRAPREPARLLITEAPGYRLRAQPETVDAVRFERLASEGHNLLDAHDPWAAIDRFDRALGLWRGEALADFRFEQFVDATVSRLDELRAAVEEDRVVAQLAVGDHTGAVRAAERLIGVHPFRERLRALQMVALYRSGRQADALRAFDAARRVLADELGLQPGPELQALVQQVLAHDPTLDAYAPAGDVPPAEPVVSGTIGARPAGSFVGRAELLDDVAGALGESLHGHTRFVLVGGEPGIGKTRLAEEISTRAAALGAKVAWGRCHDDEGMPPLWPWMQAIGTLLDVDATAAESLAALLGLEDEASDTATPDRARFRLFDAVRQRIESRASVSPIVIVLDDLQWADPSSLRLLRYLAVELRATSLLVLGTFHEPDPAADSALAGALADLGRNPSTERHTMIGWTAEDVAELVHTDTPIDVDEVGSVAAELHRRTDGNPFFVTELVRLLVSEHALGPTGSAVDIPLVVSDVIRRRMRRLPDNVRGVLAVAAVIGREFELGVLHRAAALTIDDAFEILEAAVIARVVVESGAERYRFSHGLVRETLDADLTDSRRARLHAKVGTAIEDAHQDDLQHHLGQLAHHFAAGGRDQSALEYSALAAEQAESTFAYDEAVGHWRRAIEHSSRGALAERARLLIRLSLAYQRAGDAASSADALDRAIDAADSSGDVLLAAEGALVYGELGLWQVRPYGTVDARVVNTITRALEGQPSSDSPLRARLLTGLAIAGYYDSSQHHRGRDLLREAADIARRCGDRKLLASILAELVVVLDSDPDIDEQLAVADELEALVDDATPFETAVTSRWRVLRVRLARGDARALEQTTTEVARRADEERHAVMQSWATWAQAGIAFLLGRLDEAERLAGEARDRHLQLGIWGAYETYATHMTLVWREQDRLGEVGSIVEPLLAQAQHPGARKLLALYLLERGATDGVGRLIGDDLLPLRRDFTWLSELCLTAELCAGAAIDGSEDVFAALAPFSGRFATMDGTFVCFGAVDHYLALLAESLGRRADAAALFEQAIELNDAAGAVPWSTRSRYQLARMIRHSDPARAAEAIERGVRDAAQCGLTALHRQLCELEQA